MRRERNLLVVLYPQVSHALYLESSKNTHKEDYTQLKNVLNDALVWFFYSGGSVRKPKRQSGRLVFGHKTDFPCIKQPENSMLSAYYVLHHMREYIRDEEKLRMPSQQSDHLHKWGKQLADCSDEDIRAEFYRIQQKLATIIYRDVYLSDGMFHEAIPTKPEVDDRLVLQSDPRPFKKLGELLFDMPAMRKK